MNLPPLTIVGNDNDHIILKYCKLFNTIFSTSLHSLEIHHSTVNDVIYPLSLKHLNISSTKTNTLHTISSLTQLEKLTIESTKLSFPSSLKQLTISYCTDFSLDMSLLPNLDTLTLDKVGLTSFDFLQGCTTLTTLISLHNKINNLTSLASCSKLEILLIYFNTRNIGGEHYSIDLDFSPLTSLTNLTKIYYDDTKKLFPLRNNPLLKLGDSNILIKDLP